MPPRATPRKSKRRLKRIPAFDIRDEGTSLPDKNGGRPRRVVRPPLTGATVRIGEDGEDEEDGDKGVEGDGDGRERRIERKKVGSGEKERTKSKGRRG